MTGVHLSDNGLVNDLEFKYDVMGIFGVPAQFLQDSKQFNSFMTNSIVQTPVILRAKVKEIYKRV